MSAGTQKSPTATIRCGVIGVGRMGKHHARLCAQLEGADLVGVVDESAARRSDMIEQYGCGAFASVDELIAAGVDA